MFWFAVCAAIAVLGGVYLVVQAREVWRKCVKLFEEIDAALARAEAASHPQGQRVASVVPPTGGVTDGT